MVISVELRTGRKGTQEQKAHKNKRKPPQPEAHLLQEADVVLQVEPYVLNEGLILWERRRSERGVALVKREEPDYRKDARMSEAQPPNPTNQD